MWKLIPSRSSDKVLVDFRASYRITVGNKPKYDLSFKRDGVNSEMIIKEGDEVVLRKSLYISPNNLNLLYVRNSCWRYLAGNAIQIWDRKCPNGVTATPEESAAPKFPSQKFIIWCPQSDLPPRVILDGEDVAINVAKDMAKRHHKTFYWARLEGFVESKKVTTYTEVMKTL